MYWFWVFFFLTFPEFDNTREHNYAKTWSQLYLGYWQSLGLATLPSRSDLEEFQLGQSSKAGKMQLHLKLINALPPSERPACWLGHVNWLPVSKYKNWTLLHLQEISYLIPAEVLPNFPCPPACVGSRTPTAAAGFRKAGVSFFSLWKDSVWQIAKIRFT